MYLIERRHASQADLLAQAIGDATDGAELLDLSAALTDDRCGFLRARAARGRLG